MIEIKNENDAYVAVFEGSLDSQSAREAQKEIEPLIAHADGEIVLDCTKLEYISSPGLRLFLTIKKESADKGGRVTILNVCKDVKAVFVLTGFDEFFEFRNS